MKISEHCFAITGLGFTPPWEVNAGFVCGDNRTLVVDTGPSYLAGRTVYGYASNVRPGNELLAARISLQVLDRASGVSTASPPGVATERHPVRGAHALAGGERISIPVATHRKRPSAKLVWEMHARARGSLFNERRRTR
jgi:hypothetical protein